MCYAIGDDGLPVMSEMPADTDWQGSRGREPRTETFNKEFVDENAPDQHLPWNFRKLFTAAFGSAAMLGCDDLRRRVKDLGGIKMNQYYDKVFVEAKRRRIVMEELTKNGRVGVILLPPS
jgi:hypothetical protein